MQRGFALLGPVLATAFGVFTVYTSFQPALQQQRDEKEGKFQTQHAGAVETPVNKDTAISDAILSDLRDAKREVDKSSFGWGIRQALFGSNSSAPSNQQSSDQGIKSEGKNGAEPPQASKEAGQSKT